MCIGILMFMVKLMSRRQIKYGFNTEEFIKNLNLMADTEMKDMAHPDTLAHVMKQLEPEEVSAVRVKMIKSIIRKRSLERFRLLDKYYMIAIDMTGHVGFGEKRHCEKCMSKKWGDKTYYYHAVAEAKLVTAEGLALSVGTEFVENEEGKDKQDCELRAAYRLAKNLKEQFPRLKICLLLDSLYANQQMFEICKNSEWKYIVTFKEGSMPVTYREAMTVKGLQEENRGRYVTEKVSQEYAWATEVEHEGHKINVMECVEKKKGKEKKKRFVWATNLNITRNNYAEIANNGGRCRWKIENEGFNMQKNGGYNLEHVYCSHPTAMKNFYLLLQIAHFINQLMEKGSLLKEHIRKVLGGIRNLSRRLLEELRTKTISRERLNLILETPFQIRFDSS